MTRKFKAIGLALIAVFAISVLAAQGAQAAEEFKSSANPTVLTGAYHEGTDVITLTSGLSLAVCEKAVFEGTQTGASSPTTTITPTYGSTTAPSGCKTSTGNEAIYHTNHCAFVFSAATNAEGHGKVELECEAGSQIEITIPALGVTLDIGAQTPAGGLHSTNVETGGKKELTSHATMKGIAVKCTGGACVFIGGTNQTATYNGTETIKGYKDLSCAKAGTEKTTPGDTKACEGEQVNIEKS